jgi:hypothetical protein
VDVINRACLSLALVATAVPGYVFGQAMYSRSSLASPTIPDPISVYDNWAAYDELSDNVPLTEQLTLNELDNLLRLRRDGVRFDYYVMDAFWFDPMVGIGPGRSPIGLKDRTAGFKAARTTVSCRAYGSAPTRLCI